jgi:hypothetical protein
MGTVADVLRGEWEGQTLRFVGRSPKGEARYSYRFEGNDRLHYTIENKTNGAWTVARSWSYDRRLSMS